MLLNLSLQRPNVINNSPKKEIETRRILISLDNPPLSNLRCSGLGTVPKHDGDWQIIYHLSAPPGISINDFIDPNSYTLSYCLVDDAYNIINELDTGALLSKIDLKNAFRLIPVRQSDWNLLGIHWKDIYYIDTSLPFGLRSAPFLFNQLADAIHWILQQQQQQYGVHHLLHYLDDFLRQAQQALTYVIKTCPRCCLSAVELVPPLKQKRLRDRQHTLLSWVSCWIQLPWKPVFHLNAKHYC